MSTENKKQLTDEQLDQVSGGAGDLPERETITFKGNRPPRSADECGIGPGIKLQNSNNGNGDPGKEDAPGAEKVIF